MATLEQVWRDYEQDPQPQLAQRYLSLFFRQVRGAVVNNAPVDLSHPSVRSWKAIFKTVLNLSEEHRANVLNALAMTLSEWPREFLNALELDGWLAILDEDKLLDSGVLGLLPQLNFLNFLKYFDGRVFRRIGQSSRQAPLYQKGFRLGQFTQLQSLSLSNLSDYCAWLFPEETPESSLVNLNALQIGIERSQIELSVYFDLERQFGFRELRGRLEKLSLVFIGEFIRTGVNYDLQNLSTWQPLLSKDWPALTELTLDLGILALWPDLKLSTYFPALQSLHLIWHRTSEADILTVLHQLILANRDFCNISVQANLSLPVPVAGSDRKYEDSFKFITSMQVDVGEIKYLPESMPSLKNLVLVGSLVKEGEFNDLDAMFHSTELLEAFFVRGPNTIESLTIDDGAVFGELINANSIRNFTNLQSLTCQCFLNDDSAERMRLIRELNLQRLDLDLSSLVPDLGRDAVLDDDRLTSEMIEQFHSLQVPDFKVRLLLAADMIQDLFHDYSGVFSALELDCIALSMSQLKEILGFRCFQGIRSLTLGRYAEAVLSPEFWQSIDLPELTELYFREINRDNISAELLESLWDKPSLLKVRKIRRY